MEQRVYVGGLPADVTAQELRDRFGRFVSSSSQCRVTSVELPSPKPLTPKGATRGFAYLTLQGEDAEAQSEKLHKTFNRTKWRGGLLKVQTAKLRYDLKLQQERQERQQKVDETLEKRKHEIDRMESTVAEKVQLNTAVKFKGRRKTEFKDVEEMEEVEEEMKEEKHEEKEETDDETESEGEQEIGESEEQEEEESEVLGEEDVEAFVRRMEQEAQAEEVQEVEDIAQRKEKKVLSKEEMNARRLAALAAKQQRKKEEKVAIPPMGATLGKKITFDDSGNEEEPEEKEEEGGAIANWMESDDEAEDEAARAPRTTLEFAGDEDADADAQAFALRPEFVGEKGRKLFEMQKRFGGDARFRLDARFLEEEANEYGGNDVDEADVQEVQDEAVAELQNFLDEENPEEAARLAREMREEEATALRVVAKLFPDVDVARLQWRMQNQRAPKEPLKQAAWMGELKRYDPRDAHACREFEIPMATAASGVEKDEEASTAPLTREEKEIPPTGGDRFFSTTGDLSNLFSRVRKNSEDGEEGEAALDGVFSLGSSAPESAGDAAFKLSSLFAFPVGEDKPLAALGEQLLEDEQDDAAPTLGDWAFSQGFNHAEDQDDAVATDSEAGDDAETDDEQGKQGRAQKRVKKSLDDFLAFGRTFVGGEDVADWPERRKKLTLDYKRKRRDAVKTKKRLTKQTKTNNARKKARL